MLGSVTSPRAWVQLPARADCCTQARGLVTEPVVDCCTQAHGLVAAPMADRSPDVHYASALVTAHELGNSNGN